MEAFFTRYPKEAAEETRTATVPEGAAVPAATYGFLEFYCPDVRCDCRRVVISVVAERGEKVVATLNYGWEKISFYRLWSHDDELAVQMAGVSLEPSGQQSKHAESILRLFRDFVLADPRYKARIRRHYRMFKRWRPA